MDIDIWSQGETIMERTLYDWTVEAAAALDLPANADWLSDRATVERVLDLAKDLAHGVTRPAAPVGTFLAGVATGLRGPGQPRALEDAAARLTATLAGGEASRSGGNDPGGQA
jgi:hypothetical protein